jgi:tripartite-type tricarboxylate transporter receptor subunit TctC
LFSITTVPSGPFIRSAHSRAATSVKDFQAVYLICNSPTSIVVHESVPARTLKEFIAYAKANPTKLSYGSPGTGTTHHMSMELIKSKTGAPIQHIPYRGAAPGMNDLLAGVIPIYVSSTSAAEPHMTSGKVRGLVSISKTRLPQFNQIPTLTEALPGVEIESWMGMFAPAGIPKPVEDKLANALKTVLSDPEVAALMERGGTIPRWLSPDDLAATMIRDEERWAGVIRDAGIKVE